MKEAGHTSLRESLQVILPITKGALNQLRVLAPREGTWVKSNDGGYGDEYKALAAVENYLNYLTKDNNDIKIRCTPKKEESWFGGSKTIPYPEDAL